MLFFWQIFPLKLLSLIWNTCALKSMNFYYNHWFGFWKNLIQFISRRNSVNLCTAFIKALTGIPSLLALRWVVKLCKSETRFAWSDDYQNYIKSKLPSILHQMHPHYKHTTISLLFFSPNIHFKGDGILFEPFYI